jgi:fructokinase
VTAKPAPFGAEKRNVPVIGIDVGGTKVEGVLLDDAGTVLRTVRVATPRDDYEATLEKVRSLVAALEDGLDARPPVGIGTPGAISPRTGLIKNANSTWLNGRPLAADLARVLGREVRLANDADCFALSEAIDGAARGARVVFGAILGTGVGGGIVVDRRLVTGPNAIGGEWGHNPLPWPRGDERPGPLCYCGRTGCIETLLSGPGLAADHERVTGERLLPPAIVEHAAAGDGAAESTLARYEERLARALASVINLLDPDVIVVGGGLSNLGRLYDNVPRLWTAWVFSDTVETRLVPPAHGDASGVRGAARL